MRSLGSEEHERRPTPVAGSDAFLDYTAEVFQPFAQRPLTRMDAHEIAQNMAGLIGVLCRIRRSRKSAGPQAEPGSVAAVDAAVPAFLSLEEPLGLDSGQAAFVQHTSASRARRDRWCGSENPVLGGASTPTR